MKSGLANWLKDDSISERVVLEQSTLTSPQNKSALIFTRVYYSNSKYYNKLFYRSSVQVNLNPVKFVEQNRVFFYACCSHSMCVMNVLSDASLALLV